MQGRMNGLMWMDITVVWMNAYVCVDECVYVYTHPSIHPPTHPAIHPPVQAQPYIHIYIYIYTHTHYFTCIFTYTILKRDHMVRRLAVPGPPPAWYGLVGVGGGGLACAETGGGRWSCHWMVGWCWGGGQGSHASPSQAVNPVT